MEVVDADESLLGANVDEPTKFKEDDIGDGGFCISFIQLGGATYGPVQSVYSLRYTISYEIFLTYICSGPRKSSDGSCDFTCSE